ncbi:MAG: lipid asymmetry maintenance protein MlaB [Halorhodospira sp.]
MTSDERAQRIELGEQLDVTVVASLKATLEEALAGGDPIALDGRRLGRVDGAGIQLLVAFSRAAASRGGWSWYGDELPSAVAEAASQLGVADEVAGDNTVH